MTQRVVLIRSNPAPRLAAIANAAARRQAASDIAAVPVLVNAAVDAVAADIGADLVSINDALGTVNDTLGTVNDTLGSLNSRVTALEP